MGKSREDSFVKAVGGKRFGGRGKQWSPKTENGWPITSQRLVRKSRALKGGKREKLPLKLAMDCSTPLHYQRQKGSGMAP